MPQPGGWKCEVTFNESNCNDRLAGETSIGREWNAGVKQVGRDRKNISSDRSTTHLTLTLLSVTSGDLTHPSDPSFMSQIWK